MTGCIWQTGLLPPYGPGAEAYTTSKRRVNLLAIGMSGGWLQQRERVLRLLDGGATMGVDCHAKLVKVFKVGNRTH